MSCAGFACTLLIAAFGASYPYLAAFNKEGITLKWRHPMASFDKHETVGVVLVCLVIAVLAALMG